MKLRYQLYLLLSFLFLILALGLSLNYISYKNEYQKDIQNFIDGEIKLHKKSILSSLQNRNSDFENNKDVFYKISKETVELLKKDKNLNLQGIKSALKVKYELKDFDFDLYLIDSSYKIYKTTRVKDLYLNLKNLPDAKNLIDKSRNGNIQFSNFINTDPVTLEYRLYVYSLVSEDDFLELSFSNSKISTSSISSLVKNLESNTKINIFKIFRNREGFSFYDILKSIDRENKELFYNSLDVFNDENIKENKIVNSAVNYIQEENLSNNIYKIITPVFDKNMHGVLGFENLVLEIEIDLNQKIEFMNKIRNIFVISLSSVFLVFILIFLLIQYKFTKPVEKISKSIKIFQKVDFELLKYNNEISSIASKYNILYDNFKDELELNSELLEENKKFIANTVHQIRTPLTNILMNVEMIKKFQKDSNMNIFIEQIDASIAMLSNSYEDLAYIVTSNTISYNPKVVNLTQAINDRIKFFATISKVNFKEITSLLQDNILIDINDMELERIIDNNISNAIKYGTKFKTIDILLEKKENLAILEFRSFGNEIKNKFKIFNKYFREDEAKRGLGLGLYMVSNICLKYSIKYEIFYKDGQNIFRYTFKLKHL